ncbi:MULTISPECIES: hypothetical protein [unclassified Streptomyces]|uniref:hypothetical protein n=1 Tax=unclassified Streptomyces TaxID=2593676 RepID=UPI00336A31BD
MAANATGLSAQVGASAAAGALVGSHIDTAPATEDTDAALAAGQGEAPALCHPAAAPAHRSTALGDARGGRDSPPFTRRPALLRR